MDPTRRKTRARTSDVIAVPDLAMPEHLARLHFEVQPSQDEDFPASVHFHVPASLIARPIRLDLNSIFGTLEAALATGTGSLRFRKVRAAARALCVRWHPFAHLAPVVQDLRDEDAKNLQAAALVMDMPPAVLFAALIAQDARIDLDELFPRPARGNRRRTALSNAVLFPGSAPRGNRRHA